MVMHAWLRNTVMRLRFIKPRSQVVATKASWEEKARVLSDTGSVEGEKRRRCFSPSLSLSSWQFFRQDNSSFSFLAHRVKLESRANRLPGKCARFVMHRVGNVTQWFIRGKRSASLERSARKAIGTEIPTGIYAMCVWRRTVCLRRYLLVCSVQCWTIKRKIFRIFIIEKRVTLIISWALPDHPDNMTGKLRCQMIISERQTKASQTHHEKASGSVSTFFIIIQHYTSILRLFATISNIR